MQTSDAILEKGLPANIEAERLVLGAFLTDEQACYQLAALDDDDFSIHKHRRIHARMLDIAARGEKVNRLSLIEELRKKGHLESVDGIGYIVSLDEGMPPLFNIEGYIANLKERSLRRKIIAQSQKIIDQSMLGMDDASDILTAANNGFLGLCEDLPSSGLVSAKDILQQVGLDALLSPKQGLHTNFLKFDQMTGGLQDEELMIIAARPSMGKTALALNMAQHVASQGGVVPFFSLEMGKSALMTRMLCAAARVDAQKVRMQLLNKQERALLAHAAADLADQKIFIDDSGLVTIPDVVSKLRRLRNEHGKLSAVFIDYLQLMLTGTHDRVAETSKLTRGLKLVAKELKIPMVVLSQLSRGPETRGGDHIPMLSDLRESGSIEQDADTVAFVYREEYYKPDREDLRGYADLIIAKQRNGPVGKVKLVFLKEYTKFENMASDLPDEGGDH